MRNFPVIALGALLLAGCGGNDSSAPAADAKGGEQADAGTAAALTDPCSLLTGEDVSAVVGDKVTGTEAEGAVCTYATAEDDGAKVDYYATGGREQMETAKRVARLLGGMGDAAGESAAAAGKDVKAILNEGGKANLGDESFFGPNSKLSVLKGDTYLAISPPIMHNPMTHQGNPLISGEEKRKMALQLAEKALAKLP